MKNLDEKKKEEKEEDTEKEKKEIYDSVDFDREIEIDNYELNM